MAGRATSRSSTMTAVQFKPINQPTNSIINHSHQSNQLTSPTSKSTTNQSTNQSINPPPSSRVLEIGHVFTQHYLVDHQPVKREVVVFLQSNTLFACVYQPNQTCYRNPVKRLVINQSIEVSMGKQAPALRLCESAISRRCFTIRYRSNKSMHDQSTNDLQLEAPGSGDVKYWLRCFLSVMTHQLGYKLHDNLHFINQPIYTEQSLMSCETRLRQARFDSQIVRRKEEASYRSSLIDRLRIEHKRDWRDREIEVDARGSEYVRLNSLIDRRISHAVDGSCRVRAEDALRTDAIKRMRQYREAELQSILAIQHANTQSINTFLAANKRSSSLVTHMNFPILAPRSTNSTPVSGTRSISQSIPSSKSHPNLPASTPSSPSLGLRRLSGPSDVPSPHSPAQLKLLPTVLPKNLYAKQPCNQISIPLSTNQPINQSFSRMVSQPVASLSVPSAPQAVVPPRFVSAPSRPAVVQSSFNKPSINQPLHETASQSSGRSSSLFPMASNSAFTNSYHFPLPQRSSLNQKSSTTQSISRSSYHAHSAYPGASNLISSLPMTQVCRFQPSNDPFEQLAAIKQAAPIPDTSINTSSINTSSINASRFVPTLPPPQFTVPRSTSFSIHVSLDPSRLNKTSNPAITVSVTDFNEEPPSYDSLQPNDAFSYA